MSKYVDLQVVTPKDGDHAGVDGKGWMVTVLASGNGPALEQAQPALSFVNGLGANQAFPGLVVLAKVSGDRRTNVDANQNLAKLFQMIGVQNAGGAGPVSRAGTSGGTTGATTAPSATAGSGATGGSGATTGTGATTGGAASSSSGDRVIDATWFEQQARFGTDVDVELTIFVVEGQAPDTVGDRSSLRIVSNEVTVRFHINGAGQTSTTGGGASGAPAASPSGSPSIAPSASPTSSP